MYRLQQRLLRKLGDDMAQNWCSGAKGVARSGRDMIPLRLLLGGHAARRRLTAPKLMFGRYLGVPKV